MISSRQQLGQKQTLQQRLSPQQIQYIKLLQLPTIALEQRVKQEMENNPALEEADTGQDEADYEEAEELDQGEQESTEADEELEPLDDDSRELDWEEFVPDDGEEIYQYTSNYNPDLEEWKELPRPYNETLLESLEQQTGLLSLDERKQLIAEEILGSLDSDGYLRRDMGALVDSITFHNGIMVTHEEAEDVLKQIQQLDPPGIAARDLRECLKVQLEVMGGDVEGRDLALAIVDKEWSAFQKKHFDKLKRKFNVGDRELEKAFQCIRVLDPKPGSVEETETDQGYIVPDFEVRFIPAVDEHGYEKEDEGEFVINMNERNVPSLRISNHYRQLWEQMQKKSEQKQSKDEKETRNFIREKIESARWFIDSIMQRQYTLQAVMQTIVALQENFFKHGEGIRPMILKDVADRVGMDISTISRVVNGKYVQTPYGVYELKYFFSEGVETDSGEEVSNREVKKVLQQLIDEEDKSRPLNDEVLAKKLRERGYKVARRTVSKYREQLNLPVARMRKRII